MRQNVYWTMWKQKWSTILYWLGACKWKIDSTCFYVPFFSLFSQFHWFMYMLCMGHGIRFKNYTVAVEVTTHGIHFKYVHTVLISHFTTCSKWFFHIQTHISFLSLSDRYCFWVAHDDELLKICKIFNKSITSFSPLQHTANTQHKNIPYISQATTSRNVSNISQTHLSHVESLKPLSHTNAIKSSWARRWRVVRQGTQRKEEEEEKLSENSKTRHGYMQTISLVNVFLLLLLRRRVLFICPKVFPSIVSSIQCVVVS